MKYFIGVDVGGTFIKIGVVSERGEIVEKKKIPTPKNAGYKVIIEGIREYLGKWKILGIGVGLPGLINTEKGVVHRITNIKGWNNVPLQKLIEKAVKLPAKIDNDVNCMAFAEAIFGNAKGKKNVFGITLGTGVGGGIVIDGKIYRGANFTAGEVGHVTVDKNGPKCNCGNRGCLETIAGNKRILSRAKAIGINSLEELNSAAMKGNKKAKKIWEETGECIGIVLAGVVNILNPELISIGGGVANAGDLIMKSIRKTVKNRAISVARDSVKIEFSKLGNDAGILGAAALVLEVL